jgi:hypothetical protein
MLFREAQAPSKASCSSCGQHKILEMACFVHMQDVFNGSYLGERSEVSLSSRWAITDLHSSDVTVKELAELRICGSPNGGTRLRSRDTASSLRPTFFHDLAKLCACTRSGCENGFGNSSEVCIPTLLHLRSTLLILCQVWRNSVKCARHTHCTVRR